MRVLRALPVFVITSHPLNCPVPLSGSEAAREVNRVIELHWQMMTPVWLNPSFSSERRSPQRRTCISLIMTAQFSFLTCSRSEEQGYASRDVADPTDITLCAYYDYIVIAGAVDIYVVCEVRGTRDVEQGWSMRRGCMYLQRLLSVGRSYTIQHVAATTAITNEWGNLHGHGHGYEQARDKRQKQETKKAIGGEDSRSRLYLTCTR